MAILLSRGHLAVKFRKMRVPLENSEKSAGLPCRFFAEGTTASSGVLDDFLCESVCLFLTSLPARASAHAGHVSVLLVSRFSVNPRKKERKSIYITTIP